MAIRKTKPGAKDGIAYRDGAGTEQHDGIDYDEEHRTFDQLATGGRVMERHKKDERERKERARGGSAKSGRSNDEGDEGTGNPEYFGGAESPSAKAAKGDREAATGGRIKNMRRKERKAVGASKARTGTSGSTGPATAA